MTIRNIKIRRQLIRITGSFVCAATALILVSSGAAAQTLTRSGTDQMTPANLAAGSPAGSYAVSGFDNVNLFNGNLNFRLPLLSIGGRGGAGYTMMLALNTKTWHVKRTSFTINGEETNITYTPTRNGWQGYDAGYGPGTLIGRRSGEGTKQPVIAPCTAQHPIYEKTMTRLSFTGSDGTEYEFVDQLTMGRPYTTQQSDCGQVDGFSRGRVFVTTKGEAATFISDVEIKDKNPVAFGVSIYNATGYMLLRDGTRYRIVNALVSWIQDRNGNRITFSYDGNQRVSQVVDSLNRQVNITYDNSAATDCSAHYDEITFTGFAPPTRSIKIWHQCLSSTLRSDQTIKTYTQLFPELNGSGNIVPNTFDKRVVSAMTLPDGRQYQFLYNSYAEVARVVLPTGGAYEYDYTIGSGVGDDNVTGVDKEVYRRVIERRVLPDGTNIEGRARYSPNTGIGNFATVDHWDGSATLLLSHDEHTFETGGGPLQDGFLPNVLLYSDVLDGMESQVEAKDTSGGIVTTSLRREENTYAEDLAPWTDNGFQWSINPRLKDTLNKLLDVSPALVSKRHTDYDQYFNPTNVAEYGFGVNGQPGGLVRQTTTTYVMTNGGVNYATVNPNTTNPDASATVHLRSLPLQQSVYDGPTEKARAIYEYDNYNQTTSDNFHASLTSRSSIAGLDSAYTTTRYTRGNVTATTHYLLDTGGNVTGSVSGYAQYDVAGNVVKAVDPRSTSNNIIATTFDFTDRFGVPDNEAESNTAPPGGELSGGLMTYAFATKVTSATPFNQIAYTQYDYYLGKPVNSEDPNGIVAKGRYDDLLDRPTGVDTGIFSGSQLQRHTSFSYSDSSHLITTQSDQVTLNDGVLTGTILYDGLGRTTETRTSAPEGTIYTTQQYDAMGRVKRSYNPYRTTSDPTYGYADTAYDALGRVRTVTTSDSAVVTTTYSGNSTMVTDQAGKTRRSITDGLGRLIRVDEPDSSGNLGTVAAPTQPTSYIYDVLDDLTTVTQGTQPSRSFVYDSLKRLTDATNPESGHVHYTYDANSSLATKLDAHSITTTYFYDALNRVTKRTYSDSTPEVDYYYDNQTLPTNKPPSFTPAYSTGRLIAVCYGGATSSAGSYQSYDQLGRVTSSYQQTDSQNYGFGYGYDLASEMTTETYPSGRQITTAYDIAGRISSINGQKAGEGNKTYASQFSYASHGAIAAMQLGNGKLEHTSFNNRLQPTLIGLGTSSADSSTLKLDYTYGSTANNGNVQTQTITIGATVMSQSYVYDALNRLSSATESAAWTQTYDYDRWGNRAVRAGSYIPTPRQTPTSNSPSDLPQLFNQSNNRIIATGEYGYDPAGNLTLMPDRLPGPSDTMTYDAENRQRTFNGAVGQYSYDGDGRRVKKIDSTGTTIFVYNAGGQLIAEYHSDPVPQPAGGGGTSYLTSDHLGSTRVVTKQDGTVKVRYDYLPFGEELGSGIGGRTVGLGYSAADSTKQKFTQKERDTESGLDYFFARYYSSAQGRFTSSDPLLSSGTVYDPQTWNRYSYTLNNPLKYIDPFGLYVYGSGATDELKKKFEKGLKDLENARDSFKKGSAEYKRLDRALTAYGAKGVDNGVSIIFGATKDGSPAATSPGINAPVGMKQTTADNPTGQDTRVTIDPKQNKSSDDYLFSIGHEGSHVADSTDLVGALPNDLTSPAAQAILNGALNLTKYVTETGAYGVESFVAQARGAGSLKVGPDSGAKYEIWNSGWSQADRATKRSAGIDKVLALPKSKGGYYEVTPTNQGKKLIE